VLRKGKQAIVLAVLRFTVFWLPLCYFQPLLEGFMPLMTSHFHNEPIIWIFPTGKQCHGSFIMEVVHHQWHDKCWLCWCIVACHPAIHWSKKSFSFCLYWWDCWRKWGPGFLTSFVVVFVCVQWVKMRGDIGGIVDHYCLKFLFITCIHSARFTLSNITFFFSAFAIFHYSIKDLIMVNNSTNITSHLYSLNTNKIFRYQI
jgi:hypothetical protein